MADPISRRKVIQEGALVALAMWGLRRTAIAAPVDGIPMVVYKDPSCGCCGKWVEHMKANGFATSVQDTPKMDAIKVRYKVGEKLRSCHTAVVGGYVIEGHVPAGDVKRLLKEKPKVVGLTIPGMPQSAPGMDMQPPVPYEVLAFDETDKTSSYAKH
jgi:hypothetical protein